MKRVPVLPALVVALLVLDQVSKAWVMSNVPVDQYVYPVPALAHIFAITHLRNTGVAFGMLQGANSIFIVVNAIVTLFVVRYLRSVSSDRRLMRLSLALILVGAVGNLIDRLRLGYVVDFVAVGSFYRFNVADSAVSIGTFLLVVSVWLEGRRDPSGERAELPEQADQPGA